MSTVVANESPHDILVHLEMLDAAGLFTYGATHSIARLRQLADGGASVEKLCDAVREMFSHYISGQERGTPKYNECLRIHRLMDRHLIPSPTRQQLLLFAALDTIWASEFAAPFRYPVAPPDAAHYNKLVHRPLCLAELYDKVRRQGGYDEGALLIDVAHIVENCRNYNGDGVPVTEMARKMKNLASRVVSARNISSLDPPDTAAIFGGPLVVQEPVKRIRLRLTTTTQAGPPKPASAGPSLKLVLTRPKEALAGAVVATTTTVTAPRAEPPQPSVASSSGQHGGSKVSQRKRGRRPRQVCGMCARPVSAHPAGDVWVECTSCSLWYLFSCVGLSPESKEVIAEAQSWCCPRCEEKAKPMAAAAPTTASSTKLRLALRVGSTSKAPDGTQHVNGARKTPPPPPLPPPPKLQPLVDAGSSAASSSSSSSSCSGEGSSASSSASSVSTRRYTLRKRPTGKVQRASRGEMRGPRVSTPRARAVKQQPPGPSLEDAMKECQQLAQVVAALGAQVDVKIPQWQRGENMPSLGQVVAELRAVEKRLMQLRGGR